MEFNPNELEPQFNEQRFWRKLRANLRRAGKEVIRHCLCLHYAAQKPETPLWATRRWCMAPWPTSLSRWMPFRMQCS